MNNVEPSLLTYGVQVPVIVMLIALTSNLREEGLSKHVRIAVTAWSMNLMMVGSSILNVFFQDQGRFDC